jgi:hypothetical protein
LVLNVFPNPAQGFVSIQALSQLSGDLTLEVFSAMGVRKYQVELNQFQGSYNQTIDSSEWEPGVYYVLLKSTTEQVNVLLVRI